MGTKSKDEIRTMIAKDMLDIYNRSSEVKESINDTLKDLVEYLNCLIQQIPHAATGPLIPKTPKTVRKKGIQRIETIPEDDIIEIDQSMGDTMEIKSEPMEADDTVSSRSRRAASKKAAVNIQKQQQLAMNTKLRRIGNELYIEPSSKKSRESRSKRKKSSRSSSDEDDNRGSVKHSRIEEFDDKTVKEDAQLVSDKTIVIDKKDNSPTTVKHVKKKRLSEKEEHVEKLSNIADDTVIAPIRDDVEEPSMYEDAISKPVPIMNSTMNLNSTQLHKMMNATVVLEALPPGNLNTTVTIQKRMTQDRKSSEAKIHRKKSSSKDEPNSASDVETPASEKSLQDRQKQLKATVINDIDDLLTDDESSPDIKKTRAIFKKPEEKKKRRNKMYSESSSDSDIPTSPKKSMRGMKKNRAMHDSKNGFKSNALFSPYAKESVKKRVEAFEQAGLNSPKATIDIDMPTRVTRTKTRAIAAAKAAETTDNAGDKDKNITQQLARKSLAKAKRISLAKHHKDTDDYKENLLQSAQKAGRVITNDKLNQKQQLKTTPLGKIKTQLPMSVNRLQHTPSNSQPLSNYGKAYSATRSNIATNMDSFLQQTKTTGKQNSTDKLEEKRRKPMDEDVRKKRDEALRLQTEEKRRKRQEKELKIKLAREAQERQEMEKRQKAEKEREEKARLAQQQQEKQREELEKKRLLQLQRAQEKEERRRLEEQQRQLRLQEQEEAERALAEQKRREQEAEKRREAEARAQHQAAAEAMKLKQQILTAQAKSNHANNKYNGPTSYQLESEPDDDESDNESRPKYVIPHWALAHVREGQLKMQRYIPIRAINKFFDAKKSTPDLTEFFHGIDRRRLVRTSSANWKTPPRYSMME